MFYIMPEDISKTDAAISEINAKLFATATMLLKNIAVSIANTTLKNKAELDFEDVAGGLKSVKDATAKQKKLKKEIDGLLPLRKGIDGIRAEIKKLSDTFSVILIVDELDRRLPEYAIKVLERLHHVCNALPVVQIAAYSGRVLANAVSQAHGGQGADETYIPAALSKTHYALQYGDSSYGTDARNRRTGGGKNAEIE